MKRIAITRCVKGAAIIVLFFGLSISIVHSNSGGPSAGVSGVPAGHGLPAEMTCNQSGCHDSFRLNPDMQSRIAITGLPDNYVPGQRYTLMFNIMNPDSDRQRWGFQTTPVAMDTFLRAGTLVRTDTRNTQLVSGQNGRQYISHSTLGTGQGRTGGFSWTFAWDAPATNSGDVAFFGSSNAADGDGDFSNDKIYNPTPNPVAVTKGQYSFTNIAMAANVASVSGRGMAVADYNRDGRADLFVAADGKYSLYRNNGDGTFTDVAEAAGIVANGAAGRTAAWGDYDDNGDLNLYVVNDGADKFYHNNGNGTFTDVTVTAGISGEAVGHAALWGDFNGDAYPDLYVANEGQDTLYLNNSIITRTFRKANPAAVGLTETADTLGVALADYNRDAWTDFVVVNDGSLALYRSNRDVTWTNVAATAGLTASAQSRAAVWLDYDRDRDPDLFVVNVGGDLLYRNNGDGSFTDVTMAAGMVDMSVGAAVTVADYDQDGDRDLYVANEGQDFLYRNNGNGTFNQVATFSGMTDMASGLAAAWGDINGDGHMDLVVLNAEGGNFVYQNPGRSGAAPAKMALQQMTNRSESWMAVLKEFVQSLFG